MTANCSRASHASGGILAISAASLRWNSGAAPPITFAKYFAISASTGSSTYMLPSPVSSHSRLTLYVLHRLSRATRGRGTLPVSYRLYAFCATPNFAANSVWESDLLVRSSLSRTAMPGRGAWPIFLVSATSSPPYTANYNRPDTHSQAKNIPQG
nr:MAG TPA: hypothetical protein [Caudoviricetes sp.]